MIRFGCDQPNLDSGEWFALEARRAYVLRVESLFGAAPRAGGHRSSLDKIVNAIEAGEEVPVFCDRTVSPSYVHDIAAATGRLIMNPWTYSHWISRSSLS